MGDKAESQWTEPKSHAEITLCLHYGLARKAGNAFNQSQNPKTKAAVEGIKECTALFTRS